ncbi:MAG: GNAT family N-acetyltransferase [Alphaproteobacteria bacterium]|nr:GNAT family N-acetyltransferase [Alphaproteobacteria bacterium]MCD8520522.1 GNAT family N-acetyltransferase [Alphaproteobacteria bacterium]MCD8570636.1 GNAT family N-acetyltransferase [Alphaproteobacteria bacterium]
MNDQTQMRPMDPVPGVEQLFELAHNDLNDLCDAAVTAIEAGGGFGWLNVPPRETLERYWHGVVTMPARLLLVARLDGVICGSCQLVKPPVNNEAQAHAVHLTTNFVAPWARGHGLATMLVEGAEKLARQEGFSVINLDVRETMTNAIKMYESLGFTRFGEHPHYAMVDGKPVKGFYYYKTLS